MMLFRNATERDLEAIHELAISSGVGMTTLPKEIELLRKRLSWSVASFNQKVSAPKSEYYLFVLEDPSNGKVVGTSAIESAIGHASYFYSYKLSKQTHVCHSLNIRNDYEVLNLVNDYQGCSEICTLFLDPSYRVNSNGVLLSRARFLFIANYPERFAPLIIAEMRGVSNEKGRSPFWTHVGRHFFHMPFAEADHLCLATDKQFIADLMPKHPIYVQLLAPEAQATIGNPQHSTIPAMKILMKEGFRYNNYIDIFDGGPTLEVPRDQIATSATSQRLLVKNIVQHLSGMRYLIANTDLHYRATIGHAEVDDKQGSCSIDHDVAQILQLKQGDSIRISPIGHSK